MADAGLDVVAGGEGNVSPQQEGNVSLQLEGNVSPQQTLQGGAEKNIGGGVRVEESSPVGLPQAHSSSNSLPIPSPPLPSQENPPPSAQQGMVKGKEKTTEMNIKEALYKGKSKAGGPPAATAATAAANVGGPPVMSGSESSGSQVRGSDPQEDYMTRSPPDAALYNTLTSLADE